MASPDGGGGHDPIRIAPDTELVWLPSPCPKTWRLAPRPNPSLPSPAMVRPLLFRWKRGADIRRLLTAHRFRFELGGFTGNLRPARKP
jgi:hypothetical protein